MITQLSASPDDVHALPEARGREQHRVRRHAELGEQRRSRRAALHQQRIVERHREHGLHGAQHRVAREQHEGAAFASAGAARRTRARQRRRSRAIFGDGMRAAGRAAPASRSRTPTAGGLQRRAGCRGGCAGSRRSRRPPASPTSAPSSCIRSSRCSRTMAERRWARRGGRRRGRAPRGRRRSRDRSRRSRKRQVLAELADARRPPAGHPGRRLAAASSPAEGPSTAGCAASRPSSDPMSARPGSCASVRASAVTRVRSSAAPRRGGSRRAEEALGAIANALRRIRSAALAAIGIRPACQHALDVAHEILDSIVADASRRSTASRRLRAGALRRGPRASQSGMTSP